jgi:hypothetical protein
MIMYHSPKWAIPLALIIVQPGEIEYVLGNACPLFQNLNHSPNSAIPLALIIVKPGENESSLGNDYLNHFLWK